MKGEADDYRYFLTKEGPETTRDKSENVMPDYVFVYGTLLRGQPNHNSFLGSCFCLGAATTKQQFVMFGAGFPLARLPNDDDNGYFVGHIRGEVFSVEKDVLARLDALEGHPTFYERRITDIEEFPRLTCWMYHWTEQRGSILSEQVVPEPTSKIIDWRRHIARTRYDKAV